MLKSISHVMDMSTIHIKAWPEISIIVVNYNGRAYLERCLSSLLDQDYPAYEVIVVDNGSTDGSAEYLEQAFESVQLIRAGKNLGFGQGNNLGAEHARGEYLAFLNPDTIVEPDWLFPLIRALQCDLLVGLVTAKILLMDQPERINTCGNEVHLTGLPSCRGWMLAAEAMDQSETVCSVSGAAFVMAKALFEKVGGFDGRFFLYVEDNDLSWRVQLAGYQCIYVPGSVVYHRYMPRFGPDKYFYLERNRYLMLLKSLRSWTLLLLVPAMALSEMITWGYALLQGMKHVLAKLRVYWWLICHWEEILEARREVQKLRQATDRELLGRCSYHLGYELADDGPAAKLAQAIFDPVFYMLQRACLAVVRW